jgi:hypothetical protein
MVLRLSVIKRVMRLRESLHLDAAGEAIHQRRKTGPLSPVERTCSFCGAKPMRECTTMGGRKRKFHQQRRAPQWGRR